MIGRLALMGAVGVLAAASLCIGPPEVSYAQGLPGTLTLTPSPRPSQPPVATSTPRPTATPLPLHPATTGPIFSPTPTPTRSPTRTPTPVATLTILPTPAPTRLAGSTTPLPLLSPTPGSLAAGVPALTTDLATSSLTRSSVTVTWTTSLPSTSQVEYGTLSNQAFRSPVDPSLVLAHRVVLTGLQPGTTYHFHARDTTASGAVSLSTESTFATAPIGSGPDLVSVGLEQATSTLVRVGWLTATGTVAQVEYGPTANYGSFTLLAAYARPSQDMLLTGLRPATTYHYRVKAWDAQGGLGASDDATFSTAPKGLASLIGDDTVQSDRLALPGGQASAFEYVAAQSGLASVVRVYVDAGSSAPMLRVALYADGNGAPSGILSQGSAGGLVTGWNSVNVPPVSLLGGTRYWVAVLSPLGSGTLNLRQAAAGGASMSSAQTSLAAFPQLFLAGASATHAPLAAYVQQVPPAVTVLAQTPLSAVVDDDVPVTSVQFYVDGQPAGAPLGSAPYTLSPGLDAGAPHTVWARATDALGRTATSAVVNVPNQ